MRPSTHIRASLLGLTALAASACTAPRRATPERPAVTVPSVRAQRPPAAPGPQLVAQPACAVTRLDGEDRGRLVVRGRKSALVLEPEHRGPVRVYPYDLVSVLVAVRQPIGELSVFPPSGTLWTVSCDGSRVSPFVHEDGANFGWSALASDGRRLFYSKEQVLGL